MASGIVESSNQGSESQSQEQQQQGTGGSRAHLVQRLRDAENLTAFVNELITTQAITVAGTEAAGFLIETAAEGFGLRPVAHIRPDNSSQEARAAALQAFQELIKPCVQQNKDGAIEVGAPNDLHEPQFCLVTLLRSEGQIVAVSAVVTRCMNVERARQRLMSMQLVAGYFELFTLRRNADQARAIATSHQHVLQLSTAVATAEGFDSAAMNLCNELATRTGATRVSLGWMKGRNIKVRALSHTEEFDKKQELIVELERVMEECADQEGIVQYDPNGRGTENVTRAAQALSRSQGGHTVLSLPLRRQAEVIGVVTLEFLPQNEIGPNVASGLGVAVELLAPQLYDRFQNDRYLVTKVAHSTKETAALAIGPKHMLAKVIAVLVLLGAIVLVQPWWQPMYRVSAPFEFAQLEKRVISAPFEGKIMDVGRTPDDKPLKPGDVVQAGQVLAILDTTDLRNKLHDAMGQAYSKQAQAQKDAADGKTADANIHRAEYEAARAEIDLYKGQIDRAKVVAPIEGTLLKGDIAEREGATVKVGEPLFEIAANGALRADLSVAERDIQELKVGQNVWVATNSLPSDKQKFRITRIIPEGKTKEGANNFEVYAELDENTPTNTWRPGMAGEARIEIGNRRIVWIWTHRLADFLRLKLWW